MTPRQSILQFLRRPAARLALASCLALPGAAGAQVSPPAPPPAPPPADQPEYRVKSLPTDTFKPSEEVSEDAAVPFPADI